MVMIVQPQAKPYLALDPRTKLFMLAVIGMIVIPTPESISDEVVKVVVAGLSFLLLVNMRRSGLALICSLCYALALVVNQFLALASGVTIIGLMLRLILVVLLHMMPGFIAALCFLQTTTVAAFIAAMERLHISRRVTIPFAVIFRFFPTVADEYRSIQDAMRMRGISVRRGPVAMLEYRLVPLIASTVKIGDELSAAAVARGLGVDTARTSYCRIQLHVWDGIVMVILACLLAVFYLW